MSLIAATSNPLLEQALLEKLQRHGEAGGTMGELEPVAVRLGLLQNTLKPRCREPQLVIFAADHGIAVEGIRASPEMQTDAQVQRILAGRLPVAIAARAQGIELSVVDCGIASSMPAHERMIQRKIAHGTRNARVGNAMSLEQAHAAIRAGMEIADSMPGNLLACAGLGVGSVETAVMVGAMLVAASKRHLVMVDGIAACAALMVASRIAEAVVDYCVFCRSTTHRGLDQALAQFRASALLELGLDTTDGTGACLSYPLVRNAAALLTEVADGEDPGPSQPAGVGPPVIHSLYDPGNPTV